MRSARLTTSPLPSFSKHPHRIFFALAAHTPLASSSTIHVARSSPCVVARVSGIVGLVCSALCTRKITGHTSTAYAMMTQAMRLLASPGGPAILNMAKARGHVRAGANIGNVTDEELRAVYGMISGNRIHIPPDTHVNTPPQRHTKTITHSLIYAYTYLSFHTPHVSIFFMHTGIASTLAVGRSLLASPRGPAILNMAKARGHVRACATIGTVTDEEARAICGMEYGNRHFTRKNTHKHTHTNTHTPVSHTLTHTHSFIFPYTQASFLWFRRQ